MNSSPIAHKQTLPGPGPATPKNLPISALYADVMSSFSSHDLPDSSGHYARLASNYDLLWEHTQEFRQWMATQILDIAALPPNPVIADIGGGTGIYAAELLQLLDNQASVLVLDPSAEMLAQVPILPHTRTVHASAEESRSALEDLEITEVDLVMIKEAVHHFPAPQATLGDLSRLVGPGGAMLIVMLPTRIEYPLFPEALERFTHLQPDPSTIASFLSESGLDTTRETRGFTLNLTRRHWRQMVSNRFMSLLSTFDDEELARGLSQIDDRLGDADHVTFRDNFEFICGRRPVVEF